MRNRFHTWLNLLILSLLSLASTAQDKKPLVMDNADEVQMITRSDGTYWYAYGNVAFTLGATTVTADTAIWDKTRDIIKFRGHVTALDTVKALSAEKVTYYDRDSLLIAENNVVMVHSVDSIRTESGRAEFDRSRRIVYLTESPRLYLNYPDRVDMVVVTARYLTFYDETNRASAEIEVDIRHRDMHATCGCADFFLDDNWLRMVDKPHAISSGSELDGKEMDVYMGHRAVERIDVLDDAVAVYREKQDTLGTADSLLLESRGKTELSGRKITFYFEDSKVRKIVAAGAAKSGYTPPPDDTTGMGRNDVSGDTVFVYAQDERVKKVEIKGGAEGSYYVPVESSAADSLSSDSAASPGEAIVPDSLQQATAESESGESAVLRPDSTGITSDSTGYVSRRREDTINYRAKFLEYFVDKQIIRMTNGAVVRQDRMRLEAHRIDYDIDQRVVVASALIDTTESGERVHPIMLHDESGEIFGTKLVYNVDTRKGLVEGSTSEYEQLYYSGQDLFKEGEGTYFVEDGEITSCDLPEPHFHFQSKHMKVINNNRVVAKPVVLYIETLPVLAVPYYVFPLERGRRSGILPIRIGNFEKGNQYIGNIGYYWAASQYWDLEGSVDYFENLGLVFNGLFRYSKRYAYSGQLNGSYAREQTTSAFGGTRSRRWSISGRHSQTLPYDIKFGANGTYISDQNYYTDFSTNPDQRRNRSIISKANFSKRFNRSSLSLSFSHTDNLDLQSRSSQLPSGSFTVPSFALFGSGSGTGTDFEEHWYNRVYFSYNNNFVVNLARSALADGTVSRKQYGTITHSASLTSSQTILKYLNVNPSVSGDETWYFIPETDQSETAGIPGDRSYRRASVSAGISANTKLYGTFPINIGGLQVFRHVMEPRVGFSWSPDVVKNQAVRNYTGRGGGGVRRAAMDFSLQHNFQAKVKSGESERKVDLMRISSRLSYNFEAPVRKFSILSTTFSSTLSRNINLTGNMTHDLYDANDELHFFSPRLASFSVNTTYQLRGSVADDFTRSSLDPDRPTDTLTSVFTSSSEVAVAQPQTAAPAPEKESVTWNLSLSHRYSETRSITGETTKNHWVSITFNIDLTSNWSVRYSQNYNFVNRESTEKVVEVRRRLHCWEGYFNWIPDGSREGFYFKINVISIPDIKFEKSESGVRGAVFNR